MLKHIKGDLLKITEGTILHQVNCVGATGGLAGALRQVHPDHFQAYFDAIEACRLSGNHSSTLLGEFEVGMPDDDQRIAIVHIFGQFLPGPNTDLKAVDKAFKAYAKWRSDGRDTSSVYAPYLMGCGLGGGVWSKYSAIIERHLPQCIIVQLKTK